VDVDSDLLWFLTAMLGFMAKCLNQPKDWGRNGSAAWSPSEAINPIGVDPSLSIEGQGNL